MTFISEEIIDDILEQLESTPDAYEAAMQEMELAQPILTAYFQSDNFDLFTAEERDYLQYIALIIWRSFTQVNKNQAIINEEQISEAEDLNWARLENVQSIIFRERAGIFFENYPQEDLLAFVEDALLDDEEDALVTKEGREALFITLKTVIDLLNSPD